MDESQRPAVPEKTWFTPVQARSVELAGSVSRRRYTFTKDQAKEVAPGDAPAFRLNSLITECDEYGVPVTPGVKAGGKARPKSYVKLSQKDDGTLRSEHLKTRDR